MSLQKSLKEKFGYFSKGPEVLKRKASLPGGNIAVLTTSNSKYGSTYWVVWEKPGHGWDLDSIEGFSDLESALEEFDKRE